MFQKAGHIKRIFDHSDFPAHSMFTFDVSWGSLGTSLHIEGLTKSLKILKVFFYWIRIVWKTNGYLVISTIHINENKATPL